MDADVYWLGRHVGLLREVTLDQPYYRDEWIPVDDPQFASALVAVNMVPVVLRWHDGADATPAWAMVGSGQAGPACSSALRGGGRLGRANRGTAMGWGMSAVSPATTARPPARKPKPADLDARAVKIVELAAALYENARSMHADAELETTVKEGKVERKIAITASVDLKRPNHFALRSRHAKDSDAGLELVCIGKILYAHARRLKQHTEAKAPADLAGVGQTSTRFGLAATGMLFQNVLAEDPGDRLLDGVTFCAYAGEEKVGEAKAHHVKLEPPDLEWEVWVAAEGQPFVLKVVTRTAREEVTMVTVETYRKWKVDRKTDDAAFKFLPPADAKKVKAFKRPASGNG